MNNSWRHKISHQSLSGGQEDCACAPIAAHCVRLMLSVRDAAGFHVALQVYAQLHTTNWHTRCSRKQLAKFNVCLTWKPFFNRWPKSSSPRV